MPNDNDEPSPTSRHGRTVATLDARSFRVVSPLVVVVVQVAVLLIAAGCQSEPTTPNIALDDAKNSTSNQAETRAPFKLIVSGDTHGWIMPCGCTANQSGGLLRRASYIKKQRDRHPVLVADVGGAADGTAPYQEAKFRAVLDGERLMSVEAHNLGTAELAFGVETLHAIAHDGGIPLVSANVTDDSEAFIVSDHKVVAVGGQTLLLTGVVSPSLAATIGDMDNVHVGDPADAVLQVIERTTEDYDWLVVLAYLPTDELKQLADVLPEAAAIVGGPTQQSLAPQTVGRVLVTSATNKGKFLAELMFPASPQESVSATVVEMTPEFADDPKQEKNLNNFRALLAAQDFTAAESGLLENRLYAVSPNDQVAGNDSCKTCHGATCDQWHDTKHGHAWERLVREGAHVDSYCQQCHTTGFGWSNGFVSANRTTDRLDVGCESCHGPSQDHVVNPRTKTPFDARGQCVVCHDSENSPAFVYETYWPKIRHDEPALVLDGARESKTAIDGGNNRE